jgi:phosphate butyryltransferase
MGRSAGMQIGENLEKMRLVKGVSKTRLAQALKADEEYIERIERGEVEPQVSDLLKLASALNTDIAALIYGKEFTEKKSIVTKSHERLRVERARYFEYESLAPYYSGRHIEPFIVTIRSRDHKKPEYSQHVGEEFHYVLDGTLRTIVDKDEYILNPGDSIYFDSSLPHALSAITDSVKLLATIYNGETMMQLTRGKRMRDLIQAAKLLGGKNLAVVCPDPSSMEAVNRGIEEGIINRAFLFGDLKSLPHPSLRYPDRYETDQMDHRGPDYEQSAVFKALAAVREDQCQMLMKGKVNTVDFVKGILDRQRGISTGRRLSLVSIFELPGIDRLIFLTDPGINPQLLPGKDIKASVDIIKNAIDVARSMGVAVPRIALMDANEVPSANIPSTLYEKQLSEMEWEHAVVYGPISYDLALYEESAKKKGVEQTPVTGKADILVVPYISAGNFLYKAWAMTMDAEVANVVIGARVPVILTSRSDSDMVKFLTICAGAIYSQYLLKR